jgi:hypothetical protein
MSRRRLLGPLVVVGQADACLRRTGMDRTGHLSTAGLPE